MSSPSSSPPSAKKAKKSGKDNKRSNDTVKKTQPNILVTGTPGTGKSTLCEKLCEKVKELTHYNCGEVAKEHGFLGMKTANKNWALTILVQPHNAICATVKLFALYHLATYEINQRFKFY